MARKKGKAWPWVVGGVALGGAALWGIRRWMISRREDDLELPAGVMSAGNNNLPIPGVDEAEASNEGQAQASAQRAAMGKHRAPATDAHRVKLLGNLAIRIDDPKCRIVFSESHWKGSRLDGLYNSGAVVSHEKGNKIMWTQSWDGGPVTYQKINGQIPERVGVGTAVWIAREIPEHQVLGALPYPLGASWNSYAKPMLSSMGFTRFKLNAARKVSVSLPAGAYTIIVEPSLVKKTSKWSYVKGFWKWTEDGPREKSCQSSITRFQNQVKNINCEKLATKFDRVVSPQLWRDLMTRATVTNTAPGTPTAGGRGLSYPSKSVTYRPIMTMQITNRKYGTSSTSSACYTVCAGLVVIDKAAKMHGAAVSVGAILKAVKKIGMLAGC